MNDKFIAISKALRKHLLFHGLQLMKPIIVELGNSSLSDRCQSIEQNYQYLTDYFIADKDDTERGRIATQLTAEAFLLLEDLRIAYEAQHEASSWIALKSSWAAIQEPKNKFDQLKDIFYKYLFVDNNDPKVDEDLAELNRGSDRKAMCMAVSGLTISILRHFSIQKINALANATMLCEGENLQRALTGLALIYLKYDYLLPFFPDLQIRLQVLGGVSDFNKYWQDIIRLLIETTLTSQTQNVMRQIQQDLLPKIGNKQGPIVINIEDAEEGNPLWSKEVNNTLNKHMDEITRLNQEGADFTYSSTRDVLHMGFFHNDMANWFMPFSWHHPELNINPDNKEMVLIRGLMAASIGICDIDRYATCLLYKQIGKSLQNFPIADGLSDIEQFGKVDRVDMVTPQTMARDQVRTFYRFFYHNPWQVENILPEIIKSIFQSYFFNTIVPQADERLRFADKCLHIQLYEQAEYLFKQTENADAQTLQKLGYALQKQEKYADAIAVLQHSLLLSDDEWTLHHIAACLRHSGKWEEALDYYDRLLDKQPDKQSFLQAKAKCLMEIERYQEALQLFFKLDILYPNDSNISRGLAWCAFMVDKMEYAERYFEQNIYQQDATANDWMNYGHMLFVQHHRGEALKAYRRSWELAESRQQFFRAFLKDTPILRNKKVSEEEIDLMEDIMLQSFISKSQDRRQ